MIEKVEKMDDGFQADTTKARELLRKRAEEYGAADLARTRAWSAMFRAQNELARAERGENQFVAQEMRDQDVDFRPAEMTRGPYKSRPVPGSFADLIMRYRQSPRVLAWAPSTDRKFGKILAQFMAANGRLMVADFRRGDFIGLRDTMARTPSEANNWAKVIRGTLDYAVDIEMIPFNPVAKVKRLKVPNPDGFRTWRDDEIAAYEAHWPRGSLPRLALTLALCTGAARSDLVRLGWGNLSDNRLRYRRAKTGAAVDIPILPPLDVELSQIPAGKMTFLETQAGTVRSPVALAGMMLRWVEAAGLGGRTPRATT